MALVSARPSDGKRPRDRGVWEQPGSRSMLRAMAASLRLMVLATFAAALVACSVPDNSPTPPRGSCVLVGDTWRCPDQGVYSECSSSSLICGGQCVQCQSGFEVLCVQTCSDSSMGDAGPPLDLSETRCNHQ